MESKVKDILLLLEQNGWSDLIDSRWEQQVREEILTAYPDIDIDTLDKVLEIVFLIEEKFLILFLYINKELEKWC